MIVDTIQNAARYRSLAPGFAAAFDFLSKPALDSLPPGRREIDGRRVYASIGRQDGRGKGRARFESHRTYIDIQYTVAGSELIGWQDRASCTPDSAGYNEERDIEFYTDEPRLWIPVPPGCFAVFFPEDAHAPLGGDGPVHKIVVKVAVGG